MPGASMKVWLKVCLAVLPLTSCGGGGGATTPGKPVITTLSVSLDPATITVGGASTAKATGRDQFGNAIETGAVNWTSSAQNVATVNGAGIVQGITIGQANINASAGAT